MSKPAMYAIAFVVLIVAGSSDVGAQCVTFSPMVPCSPRSTPPPVWQVDFGARPAPDATATTDKRTPPPVAVASRPPAIDCKMVKPVDPAFSSAMPIARPNPNVTYAMKTMPAPACAP